MDPRILLTTTAIRCRMEADELRLMAHAAIRNAEMLEGLICGGSDEEVLEALKKVTEAQR